MNWIAPCTIAIPILGAALVLVLYRHLPRMISDALATAVPASLVVLDAFLLARSDTGGQRVVTWASGWLPVHGFSVGIVLIADPLGTGIALLAAALTTLALLYSWRYVDSAEGHFHGLVLLFVAGMEGFSLTGDLFDMFVFFELMGAAAYALTGMKVEDEGSLQGGMNFGIMNSLGAYIALMGVGILYAKTGNLGFPEMGRGLAGHRADALVIAAFVMLMAGFLVKGSMAPFHFWLADAHAVAPSPICLLFSGVMVPLGIYGAFRVYWVIFSGSIAIGPARHTFLVLGTVTAVVGAVMCLQQRNFKRLLAYSTIGHVGLFLLALGTLTASGTAGAALYIAGHAGVKGALFLLAGIWLNRYGTVDEAELFGRGGDGRVVRWLVVIGALGLACLPPFGTALGKSIGEEAASSAGYPWVTVVFVAVSGLTGGAVLRAAGRVGWGLGHRPAVSSAGAGSGGSSEGNEERDTDAPLQRIPATMMIPVLVLLAGSLAIGVVPGVHESAQAAGRFFVDPASYRAQALSLGSPARPPAGPGVADWSLSGVILGLVSTALALVVAAAGLWGAPRALGRRLPRWKLVRRPLGVLSDLHSGHIGDYVAWLFLGLAVLAGLVAV